MSTPPAPTVVHADLDAFFASVEQRDDPSLASRAVIVGGTGPRGVVATCSYPARLAGVSSAMPMSRARALCPDAIVISPRMEVYRQVSAQVFAVFEELADVVEAVSIDEAYLDVTDRLGRNASPAVLAAHLEELRNRVRAATDLAVSVGAGPSKLVAKLASQAAKPDGSLVIPPERVRDFLADHAAADLPGVGPATAASLADLGITTLAQLAVTDPDTLARTLGARRAHQLVALAHGDDDRAVVVRGARKQVGAEETFDTDLADPAAITAALDRVLARLEERRDGRAGRTVTLKVRLADFTTLTRSHTLDHATTDHDEIAAHARALLDAHALPAPVRLVGVSLSGLVAIDTDAGTQLRLFDPYAAPTGRVTHPDLGPGTLVGRDGARARVVFDVLGPGAVEVGASVLTHHP